MKAIKNMLYIAAMATAITACTSEDPLVSQGNGSPLTVSATIPGDVWATASRADDGYSDWKLYYTNYKNEDKEYTVPNVTVSNGTVSFTTGSDLVWAQIKDSGDEETLYLTCQSNEGTYYATAEVAHGATSVAFGTMVPTLAKFTVNFALTQNLPSSPTVGDFSISFSAKSIKEASEDEPVVYNPRTNKGVWPVGTDEITCFSSLTGTAGTNLYTLTGTMLLPEQTLGNELTVTYGSYTWKANLSQLKVKNTDPVQYAHQLQAGQHLTLNLKASITSINTPSLEVEAFTNGSDYESNLGGTIPTNQ